MLSFIKKNKNIFLKTIYIFTVFFISFTLFNSLKNNFYYSQGDAAFFVDFIFNIAKTNKFESNIFSSFWYHASYLTKSSEQYCKDFNLYNLSNINNISMIKYNHAYLIAYPISFLVKIGLTAHNVSAFIFTLNWVLIFYCIYNFLKKKIKIILSLSFLFLLINWPPFLYGIYGQYYFDRLFILPMIFTIFLYYDFFKNNKNYLLIIFLALLTSLIHERAALMMGFFLSFYSLLKTNFKILKNLKIFFIFMLGIILIFYYFLYSKFYQISYYESSVSLTTMVHNFYRLFFDDEYLSQTIKLLLVSLPFFILSIPNLRLFIISLMSIIPNILITIGGAEKIGFSTHYHSFYVPFLVASSAIGILEFCSSSNNKLRVNKNFIIYTTSALLLIFTLFYDFSKNKIISYSKSSYGKNLFIRNFFYVFNQNSYNFYYNNIYLKNSSLRNNIPDKTTISLDEYIMPFFSTSNIMFNVFPLGVGKVDYVIAPYSKIGNVYDLTIPSFTDSINQSKIKICVADVLREKYVKIKDFDYFSGARYSLYKIK
jgi:hypothetical protein